MSIEGKYETRNSPLIETYDEENFKTTSPFDVQNWLRLLESETFDTKIIEISKVEAQAIVSHYCHHIVKGNSCSESTDNPSVVEELVKRIDEVISKTSWKKCFIRLCSLSPKDAVFNGAQYGDQLKCCDRLRGFLETSFFKIYAANDGNMQKSDTLENREYCALIKSCLKSLAVENGKEAMDLLLHSERVYSDLIARIKFQDRHPIYLILRQWSPEVRLSKEFRCFVYNNALTAISQYDNVCYFPKLQASAENYKEIIQSYFKEKLKPRLESYATYVVDVALLQNDSPIVIELNPYSELTSAALFNWKNDEDLLKSGPVEIRINTQSPCQEVLKVWNSVAPPEGNLLDSVRESVMKKKHAMDLRNASWFSSDFLGKLKMQIHNGT